MNENKLLERFNLKYNGKNLEMKDLDNHKKVFSRDDEWEIEYEKELNKLSKFLFDDERTVMYHSFRNFPYIQHGDLNGYDSAGKINNYTRCDLYFIKLVRYLTEFKKNKCSFVDVDWMVNNVERGHLSSDCKMTELPIDEIFRIFEDFHSIENNKEQRKTKLWEKLK